MENVRNRVNVHLLRSDEEEKIKRLVAKPTFGQHVIFNPFLVGVQNRKEKVVLNKPIYVGMSVLDLSKHLMYSFYYNNIKTKYTDQVHLCYTDTDSIILHVQTEDIYRDMQANLSDYDTSNYPADHPLFSNANKKVIGKFKDELGGKLMTEFVGIRPKMYSYTGEDSGKRAKGVKKSVLKKTITHEDYKKPNGTKLHTYPAIKYAEDRDALQQGLVDGPICTTATDEYTTNKDVKFFGTTIESVCGGHAGIETRMPVTWAKLVNTGRISLERFAAITSTNAAKILGMYPKKGAIAVGSDADICIWDPNLSKKLTLDDMHHDGDYSIWEDFQCDGYPVMTILRGKVIVEDGKLTGSSSDGRWISRKVAPSVLANPTV